MSYDAKNKVGLGFYHLDPRWTTYEEFDWFVDRGYLNSFVLSAETNTLSGVIGGAQKVMENGGQVWLTIPAFLSCEQSISDYMEGIAKKVNTLKDKGVWEGVVGFHWDEPLLNPKLQMPLLMPKIKVLDFSYTHAPLSNWNELVFL